MKCGIGQDLDNNGELIVEGYLGAVKTKPELFLKLIRRVSKPEYTMNFMEDRQGRKVMFYNYKGPDFVEGDCVLLKATIAEHRVDKYDGGSPLTYINRVTVLKNMGSKNKPVKTWQEILAEENEVS
jgi:hypothetical protein